MGIRTSFCSLATCSKKFNKKHCRRRFSPFRNKLRMGKVAGSSNLWRSALGPGPLVTRPATHYWLEREKERDQRARPGAPLFFGQIRLQASHHAQTSRG